MSKDTGKKVALGALIAGSIGYLAGVLTAPKSGKETRQDILDGAIRAKKEAEKKLKALHSELHARLIEAKKELSKLSGRAKTELEDAINSASSAKEKVRDILSALHDGDADDPDLRRALNDAKTALKNLEKYVKS